MAADMKETIAEAARRLLARKDTGKLTVKNIVEECQITRQAFYYHFEGIPELFQWMMEKDSERILRQAEAQEDPEQGLRCFFVMAVNSLPMLKKGMQGNYREELERLLINVIRSFFARVVAEKGLYSGCTFSEVQLILRYHSQAVIGLFREWTERDTGNLDQIVHIVYRLMTEGIPPMAEAADEL